MLRVMPLIMQSNKSDGRMKTDEFKFEFSRLMGQFDGSGEEFCCQIGWSDRKKS